MADTTLTELQRAVLQLFFTLPESEGFVLAGGAGLVATGLSTRPTQDIDLFGADLAIGVAPAANALEASCLTRRWTVERIRDSATFRRLIIRRDDEELLVDLAIDTPPLGAPTITTLGPTYPVEELAARKVLALFDRAEARDFVDIHALSEHFDLDRLTDLAGQLDGGFTSDLLAESLASHQRFSDDELTALGADADQLRGFIEQWRARLLDQGK
ncbi:MAG: nucleotidyl transferase AbiEii/AbiGii toxin family protein [Solirubrobacterales bacterium]